MKTLILATAIAATNPVSIQSEFVNACKNGSKTDVQCINAGARIFEFVEACKGGDKSFNECNIEALRREVL